MNPFNLCTRMPALPGAICSLLCGAAALAAEQPGGVTEAPREVANHAGIIRGWNEESFRRGERLYNAICITCHGNLDQAGSLPASRPFWKEPFKNGADPHSLYRTITEGYGQMPAWPWLTPELRYDVVHYIREAFVKPHNPGAYFPVTEAYLDSLPNEALRVGGKSAQMIEFEKGPPYLRMDFGPVLFWTIEVEPGNIAQKGIAVRVDSGPGGISKGRAWMLYDHDTMRLAAAWTGEGFIDWKGIAFDGSHGTHAKVAGKIAMANPAGPGWADPETGSFEDRRLKGLDGRRYGPLSRDWAHYKGLYLDGSAVVLRYTVGETEILEQPALEQGGSRPIFSRRLQIGKSARDLLLRVGPESCSAAVIGEDTIQLAATNGFHLLRIPAKATPTRVKVLIGSGADAGGVDPLAVYALVAEPAPGLGGRIRGGPGRWQQVVRTEVMPMPGGNDRANPFRVENLTVPNLSANPWNAWMRLGGFDFYQDGDRAAVCTWNGDVWEVRGITGNGTLEWRRLVAGLFQPLGLKILDGVIHVTCRDQIARLHDLNGDGEIDFIENFNNDHQVTEHFHEFAMGLQTDREGNFYYAKSARHALKPLVPHHGTLLKVSADGSTTEIVASGFRAANGVCVNGDGTFFVTDQEGHWIPKNRINLVRRGGFYGNMWSYHHPESSADEAMDPPLVWITNEMDRSPGELVRVPEGTWGPFSGQLLNLSYGTGRLFLVPYERVDGLVQGGVVRLPIPDFPTGIMRGRFHPETGDLFGCGMTAWASNQTEDGGFYRIRYTGGPAYLPLQMRARSEGMELVFSEPLDRASAMDRRDYRVRVWSLVRSSEYGSDHHDERELTVRGVRLSADGRRVLLEIPDLKPTWCMAVECSLRGAAGEEIVRVVHNTVHRLGK